MSQDYTSPAERLASVLSERIGEPVEAQQIRLQLGRRSKGVVERLTDSQVNCLLEAVSHPVKSQGINSKQLDSNASVIDLKVDGKTLFRQVDEVVTANELTLQPLQNVELEAASSTISNEKLPESVELDRSSPTLAAQESQAPSSTIAGEELPGLEAVSPTIAEEELPESFEVKAASSTIAEEKPESVELNGSSPTLATQEPEVSQSAELLQSEAPNSTIAVEELPKLVELEVPSSTITDEDRIESQETQVVQPRYEAKQFSDIADGWTVWDHQHEEISSPTLSWEGGFAENQARHIAETYNQLEETRNELQNLRQQYKELSDRYSPVEAIRQEAEIAALLPDGWSLDDNKLYEDKAEAIDKWVVCTPGGDPLFSFDKNAGVDELAQKLKELGGTAFDEFNHKLSKVLTANPAVGSQSEITADLNSHSESAVAEIATAPLKLTDSSEAAEFVEAINPQASDAIQSVAATSTIERTLDSTVEQLGLLPEPERKFFQRFTEDLNRWAKSEKVQAVKDRAVEDTGKTLTALSQGIKGAGDWLSSRGKALQEYKERSQHAANVVQTLGNRQGNLYAWRNENGLTTLTDIKGHRGELLRVENGKITHNKLNLTDISRIEDLGRAIALSKEQHQKLQTQPAQTQSLRFRPA